MKFIVHHALVSQRKWALNLVFFFQTAVQNAWALHCFVVFQTRLRANFCFIDWNICGRISHNFWQTAVKCWALSDASYCYDFRQILLEGDQPARLFLRAHDSFFCPWSRSPEASELRLGFRCKENGYMYLSRSECVKVLDKHMFEKFWIRHHQYRSSSFKSPETKQMANVSNDCR